eukprot:TRINITY_DN4146_c0_g1_i1.p1 TRINITY_DN4146_c0_g1~~TRINITY_DN4146_c0_g1_i1.p1  ORF type:complete len:401 (-),score=97.22 TRINITY_DN4146_c0_g1_i1:140-1342(-)
MASPSRTEPDEEELRSYVNENLPVLDLTISEENIEQDTLRVLAKFLPTWSTTNVALKQFTDGITNKLYKVVAEDENKQYSALLRIYGKHTELLIDREQEIRSMVWLSRYGLSSPVVGRFQNGMCYGFVAGTAFTPDDMIADTKWQLVAKHLAYFHSASSVGPEVKASLFSTFDKWLALVPDSEPRKKEVVDEHKWLMSTLEKVLHGRTPTVAYCHNDLLCANMVYRPSSLATSKEGSKPVLSMSASFSVEPRVAFIDVEYSSFNYTSYDIANHFNEMMGYRLDASRFPPADFQKKWIKTYLSHWKTLQRLRKEGKLPARAVDYDGEGTEVEDEEVEHLFVEIGPFNVAAHLLWGVWALVQAAFSDRTDFDYVEYSKLLFSVYYLRKKLVFPETEANVRND